MPKYIAQVNVNEQEFQNPQDLITTWGKIRQDVEQLGGELTDTYAILGNYDFHITFTVDDREIAFQVTKIIESRGFDTKTVAALPLERIGEIVDDI